MIRFLLNFVLFGMLFYAIWYFFPDAFAVLVSWMGKFFEWLRDVIIWAYTQLSHWLTREGVPTPPA